MTKAPSPLLCISSSSALLPMFALSSGKISFSSFNGNSNFSPRIQMQHCPEAYKRPFLPHVLVKSKKRKKKKKILEEIPCPQ